MEVYVDDLIIESKKISDLSINMIKTFQKTRATRMRLDQRKCVFKVPSGKPLGFIVSKQVLEADPANIKGIQEMKTPMNVKDIQKLSGCIAYLSKFLYKMGEKTTALQTFEREQLLCVDRRL